MERTDRKRFGHPSHIRKCSILLGSLIFGSSVCLGQTPVSPVQTELIGVLDLSRQHDGSPVLLRVMEPWTGPGCTLKPGSIVEGHVAGFSMRSKADANSHLTIAFQTTACSAAFGAPYPFLVAALIAPSPNAFSNVAEGTPLADVPALSIGGGGSSQFRSVDTASALNTYSGDLPTLAPRSILPGQVLALPKVTLKLPTDGGDSVITGVRQNLRFEPATHFILIAASARPTLPLTAQAASQSAGTAKAPGALSAPMPVATPEPADEMEVCEGACGVVGDAVAAGGSGKGPAATVSLARLGYAPRLHGEVGAFDYETTLTWLDAGHLLCTFDPHMLRTRTAYSPESSRTIVGVVIDAATHEVQRTVKWRVVGGQRYLWQVGGSHILIRTGHELRLLDAELKPVRSYRVERPVAWVTASPSGDHVAVGLIEERHSAGLHEELAAKLGHEPEEDIDVVILDGNLGPLATTRRTSATAAPVLTDGGELRMKDLGHGRWKISEYNWNRTEHDLVSTKSTCRPTLTAEATGLVFAVGCTSSGQWYRMLRPDGRPLLKGLSSSSELGQNAEATSGAEFAVRVVEGAKARMHNQPFRRDDLLKEQISVYRAKDGGYIASFDTSDFTLSQLGFTLSPDGSQMASAGSQAVLFFAVPPVKP